MNIINRTDLHHKPLWQLIVTLYRQIRHKVDKANNSFSVDCNICKSKNFSVFCTLNTAEVAHFNDHKSCIVYRKGQYIFHENGYPLGVYCINSGKVKIVRTGNDGKDQIVRMAKNGDILGYRSLLSDTNTMPVPSPSTTPTCALYQKVASLMSCSPTQDYHWK